jgi:NADH-quinone oxidoreductase subunit G
MAIVIIDGKELELDDRQRLNGIQAAELLGIEIPHYCWHPGLSVVGSCRMCLVEVGSRNPETGQTTMLPKLVPACQTPAADGTVLVTNSEKVQRARAMVEEGLLLRHPIDCPICDKAGECLLQDYHFEYGQDQRRADIRPFTSRRRDIGDVTLFVDRCIMCSRCVRFTREVSGTGELMVIRRGANEEIDVVPEFPLNNKLSGNVVDLCPVGALGDKDFLYKQRVWFLKRREGVCTRCATGCSIWIEENQDRIYRIKPRENPHVNKWWICNDGRYDYPHVHSPRRIVQPRRRQGDSTEAADWTALARELNERFAAVAEKGRLAAVLSPMLSVEEAWMLARWIRRLDENAALALGPVPVVGEDETYPGGFTIAAEKCPNRRGVEEVLAHFTGKVTSFEELLGQVDRGEIVGIWVSGGYREGWIDEPTAERLARAELVVVQDLFPSPLTERAAYVLPGAAYAERDGSYVNRGDRIQSVDWAVRPPAGVRPEGNLFWELSEGQGLYKASAVMAEIAASARYFAAAAAGIGEWGIDLKVNLLADAGAEGSMNA